MENEKLFTMPFAKVYPLLVAKAERKNRTKQEVDQIIAWLTGYDEAGLEQQLKNQVDCRTFFDEAPCFLPNAALIKGSICGYRVEEIQDRATRSWLKRSRTNSRLHVA